MIKSVPDGSGGTTRTVQPSPYPWARARRFDPWTSHAQFIDLQVFQGQDGSQPLKTVAVARAQLKDGSHWIYMYPDFISCFGAQVIADSLFRFSVPNYPGTWAGEWFNAVLRPTGGSKLTPAGFDALAAVTGADGSGC